MYRRIEDGTVAAVRFILHRWKYKDVADETGLRRNQVKSYIQNENEIWDSAWSGMDKWRNDILTGKMTLPSGMRLKSKHYMIHF